jgi:hypothetical protein
MMMMRTAACCKLQLTHLRALTANYLLFHHEHTQIAKRKTQAVLDSKNKNGHRKIHAERCPPHGYSLVDGDQLSYPIRQGRYC